MARPRKNPTQKRTASVVRNQKTASQKLTENGGIATAKGFAAVMAALVGDILGGRIAPNVANAACNASGKLLKVVEMQHKYGSRALRLPAATK